MFIDASKCREYGSRTGMAISASGARLSTKGKVSSSMLAILYFSGWASKPLILKVVGMWQSWQVFGSLPNGLISFW
jgi:hypothetical protein